MSRWTYDLRVAVQVIERVVIRIFVSGLEDHDHVGSVQKCQNKVLASFRKTGPTLVIKYDPKMDIFWIILSGDVVS